MPILALSESSKNDENNDINCNHIYYKQMAFVKNWQIVNLSQFKQNQKNWPGVEVAGKYRKEIELSTQKIKNGNLPMPNSALKTRFDLLI